MQAEKNWRCPLLSGPTQQEARTKEVPGCGDPQQGPKRKGGQVGDRVKMPPVPERPRAGGSQGGVQGLRASPWDRSVWSRGSRCIPEADPTEWPRRWPRPPGWPAAVCLGAASCLPQPGDRACPKFWALAYPHHAALTPSLAPQPASHLPESLSWAHWGCWPQGEPDLQLLQDR